MNDYPRQKLAEILAQYTTTIIGDTMDTDIRGGVQMSYKTILVLSGITKREQLSRYAYKPDLVVESVNEIKFPLPWW